MSSLLLLALLAQTPAPTPTPVPSPTPAPAPAAPVAPATEDDADFRFAERLFAQQDFYRAISFYKRYLFLIPQGEHAAMARFRIGQCYRQGRRWNHALAAYQELARTHPEDALAWEGRLEAGYTQLSLRAAALARNALTGVVEAEAAPADVRVRARYLTAVTYVLERRYEDAAATLEDVAAAPEADALGLSNAGKLAAFVRRGRDLPQKSPVLAGILAAIFPGTGHIYAGRPADALESLLFTGIFAFLAGYSEVADLGVGVTATAGTVGGLFYLTNIYGAVNVTRQHNRLVKADFENEVMRRAGPQRMLAPMPERVPSVTLLSGSF